MGFFKRIFSREEKQTLDKGLERSKKGFFEKLTHLIAGKSKVDEDVLDELEEIFMSSDIGPDTTIQIIDRIRDRVSRDKYVGTDELNKLIYEEIAAMLADDVNDSGLQSFEVPVDKRPM